VPSPFGHQVLQGLTKSKGRSIVVEIGLGYFVAPCPFVKGIIGRAFIFEFNDPQMIASAIVESFLVGFIA
jgi:hypothetical protein